MGILTAVVVVAGAGLGAVAGPAAVVGAIGYIGFKSVGIAAGSYAASMMSAAALANEGAVAVGSTVAVLQSIGMTGCLSGAATAVASAVGGAAGAAAGAILV